MAEPRARTLLVFAHPALERGRVNPAMAEAVRDLPAALREPLERLAQRLGTLAEGQVLTRIND